MRMRQMIATLAAAMPAAAPASGAGLKTQFGEVIVKGLKIGKTYSMHKLVNLPLRLVNARTPPPHSTMRFDFLVIIRRSRWRAAVLPVGGSVQLFRSPRSCGFDPSSSRQSNGIMNGEVPPEAVAKKGQETLQDAREHLDSPVVYSIVGEGADRTDSTNALGDACDQIR